MSRETDQQSAIKALVQGLLLFAALGMVLPAMVLSMYWLEGKNLYTMGFHIASLQWRTVAVYFVAVIVIWSSILLWHFRWLLKNELKTAHFRLQARTALLLPLALLLPSLTVWLSRKPFSWQLLRIFNDFVGNFGPSRGLLLTELQFIFYILQSLLFFSILQLFQKAGEELLGRVWLPWGGMGLMLTWGLASTLINPGSIADMIFISLLTGILYVAGKKSFYPPFLYLILSYFI